MANGYVVQMTLPAVTGLPRDAIVNTFALTSGVTVPATLAADIEQFWNEPISGLPSVSLSNYIAGSVSRVDEVEIVAYDLTEAEPRTPIPVDGFLLESGTSFALPQEVSLCTSIAAAAAAGSPPARRRGRMYIGPLVTDALEDGATPARPAGTLVDLLAQSTERLCIALDGRFGVWSRADDVVRAVVRGWVDDEFDTQRRRGWESTYRELWSIAP